MSTQKVSFARSGIIAAIVLFMLLATALLGGNYWVRLTLIILGIGITLVYIGRSLAALRTTEGEHRTASAIQLGVDIILGLSIVLDGARLLRYNLPIPDIPYTIVFWLFLFAIKLMANNTWGKAESRLLWQFLISVIIVVGGIFAWVSLMG